MATVGQRRTGAGGLEHSICFPADIASKGIQLDALEMVRRAERGVGLAIRKGQAEGEVRDRSHGGPKRDYIRGGSVVRVDQSSDTTLIYSPSDIAPHHELAGGAGIYAMTDGVTDEQFDAAPEDAKRPTKLEPDGALLAA